MTLHCTFELLYAINLFIYIKEAGVDSVQVDCLGLNGCRFLRINTDVL